MFQQTADKAPASFHDIAAYFSDEEWKLLHEWQKDLYRNVMKDIHEALLSLGPLIAASVFSLRAKEQEYIFPNVNENSERRYSTCSSTNGFHISVFNFLQGFPIQENDLSLMEEDELSKSIIGQAAVEGESSSCLSSAEKAVIASVVSFKIKGDGERLCLDHDDFERTKRLNSSPAVTEHEATPPVVLFQIKEETVMCPVNHKNSDGKERIQHTPGEDWTMRRKVENQNSATHEVKATHFQPAVKNANIDEPRSSKKVAHSRDQLLPQNVDEQEVMEIIPWENSFSDPEHVNLQQDASNFGRSVTYNASNINLSSAVISACIGQTEKTQQQSTYTEPKKHFSPEKEFIHLNRMHTDERPHTCTYCDKRFSRKGDLNRHLTTHTGEKPYTCSYCHKSFNRKFNLNGHRRTHYQGRRNQRKYMGHSQMESTTNGNP